MEVILKKKMGNLGEEGDIVRVKPGYARNWLFPQGIAIVASKGNKKSTEHNRSQTEHKEAQFKEQARKLAIKLDKATITLKVKATGEQDKIFGSITTLQIAQALKSQLKIQLDAKNIDIKKSIKTLGSHKVDLSLYKDISCKLTVNIVKE